MADESLTSVPRKTIRYLRSREYTSLDRSPTKVSFVKVGAIPARLAVQHDFDL